MDVHSPTSLEDYIAFGQDNDHLTYLNFHDTGKPTLNELDKMESPILGFPQEYDSLESDHESLGGSVSSLSQDDEHILFNRDTSEDPVSSIPDDCGHRLVPTVVDDIAAALPQKPFISLANTANPKDGFKDITYDAFARAVDRSAWWIEQNLGRSSTFETLFTYLEPQDLRHGILVLAAIKTGYKVSGEYTIVRLSAHTPFCRCSSAPLPTA